MTVSDYETGEIGSNGTSNFANYEYNGDEWKHRNNKMICETCMWFVYKIPTNTKPRNFGRCRRHAPTMNGYPAVFGTDWCGDHKLDENKI